METEQTLRQREGGHGSERRQSDVNIRSGPQGREYDAIADRIAADRPGRVLDWGCGWGQVTSRLLERGVETVAFDYDESAERPAQVPMDRFPELTQWVSSEPVALPFADGEFDAVLSCGVLEHVHQPAASLDELHRVLRPGGRLYVYKLPNRFSYLEKIAKRIGWYYHGAMPNDRVYDLHGAEQLIGMHGFTIEESARTNLLPLSIPGAFTERHADRIWRANVALGRVPGLSLLATNVEVVARRL
jgi:cyclopropane fatty-acyl-phospholipid synthase-like methyltransferase